MAKSSNVKPIIDVDKLEADVRLLVRGIPLDDDKYIEMIAGIPSGKDIFRDTVGHPNDRGLAWMDAWRVCMEDMLLSRDIQGMMTVCYYAVVRLKAHVEALAFAAGAAQPYVFHSMDTKTGLSKGRETKAHKTTDRQKRITRAVKKRMADNCRDSLHSARQHVADNSLALLGETLSFDSVRRATAAMKGGKKKKK